MDLLDRGALERIAHALAVPLSQVAKSERARERKAQRRGVASGHTVTASK
jgi:hypothetical protein